jgi:hypothetical protein
MVKVFASIPKVKGSNLMGGVVCCRNPTFGRVDDTHTPEMGTWESSGTLEISEFHCRGQNTLPWGVPYIIGKLSKCRCQKWPHMSHLDICNISYGKKKGQDSNLQFDFRPLKVRNQPDPSVCRGSVMHRWKAFKKSYKFDLNFIPIEGLSKKLWTRKVPGVETETISRLLLGSFATKSHSNVGVVERRKEYYMGEGGGFPWVRAVVSLVSSRLLVACLSTKGASKCELTNLLVGLMQVQVSN